MDHRCVEGGRLRLAHLILIGPHGDGVSIEGVPGEGAPRPHAGTGAPLLDIYPVRIGLQKAADRVVPARGEVQDLRKEGEGHVLSHVGGWMDGG